MSEKVSIVVLALAIAATFIWRTDLVEAQIVTDGLVSYWTSDESDTEDGVVKDIAGDNDGTIQGAQPVDDGKIDEADWKAVEQYRDAHPEAVMLDAQIYHTIIEQYETSLKKKARK